MTSESTLIKSVAVDSKSTIPSPKIGPVPCERPHLKALTGIRGYAALLIVAFHTISSFGLDNKHALFNSIQVPQAVSMFFVLSGFILTFSHPRLSGLRELAAFMSMRMSRIVPSHLVCLLVSVILFCVLLHDKFYLDRTLCQLFLLHSLVPLKEFFFHLNIVTWSISTEFIFYLFFPVLLSLSRRNLTLPLFLAGLSTALSISLSCWLYNPVDANDVWFGVVQINPFSRVFEFALGIVTAQLFLGSQTIATSSKKLKVLLLEIGAVVALYFSISLMPALITIYGAKILPPPVMFYLCGCGGAIFYAYIILVLARGRGFLSAFLGHPVSVFIGEISFAIYMTHVMIFIAFWRFGALSQGYPRLGLYLVYLCLTFTIASLMHFFVELPCREWWKQRYPKSFFLKKEQSLNKQPL